MTQRVLTDRDVREIRRLRRTGLWSTARLASRYGVCGETIRRVDTAVIYKDVR